MVRIVERRVGFCYKYYIPSFQNNNNYSNLFDLKLAIIFFAIEDSPINRYYNSQNGGTMGVRITSSRPGSLDFTDEKGPEAFAFGLPMEYFLKIFRGWVDSPLL